MEVYPEIKSGFFIIIMSCTAREIRLLGKQAVLLHHTAAEYLMCLNPSHPFIFHFFLALLRLDEYLINQNWNITITINKRPVEETLQKLLILAARMATDATRFKDDQSPGGTGSRPAEGLSQFNSIPGSFLHKSHQAAQPAAVGRLLRGCGQTDVTTSQHLLSY